MRTETFFNRREILIDLSHRCALECPRCQRQQFYTGRYGNKVPGKDLPMRTLELAIKHLDQIPKDIYDSETKKLTRNTYIGFGGQLSDPIHYPKLIETLKLCRKYNIKTRVQTASSFKPISWYIKAFEADPDTEWQFGLDGLPEESHKYRVNQDGKKIFQVMLEGKKILTKAPIWQYIIFRYNENHQRQAKRMAKQNGLRFVLMKSSRWYSDNVLTDMKNKMNEYDELMPSRNNRLDTTF